MTPGWWIRLPSLDIAEWEKKKRNVKRNQKEEKSEKHLPTLEEVGTTSSTSGSLSEKTFF